jgi:predicted RNase H-like HicB family nuclease
VAFAIGAFAMAHYIAVLHHENGAYGVIFPDFPGCISAGTSFDDAIHQGAEALAFHVAGLQEDGEAIPCPRSLEAIRATEDWIDWRDAYIALIPLLPAPDIADRINVTLPRRLLAQIDAVTRNRSGFLAQAAAQALQRRAN